jgi:hypothetical protein
VGRQLPEQYAGSDTNGNQKRCLAERDFAAAMEFFDDN